MKTINKEYIIPATIEKVWDALTNPTTVAIWTKDNAKISDKVKDKFELWAGEIHGRNIKVIKKKLLVQEWSSGKWEKPSKVTFELSKNKNSTVLKIKHEDFPIEEGKELEDGWDRYYFNPIKDMFDKWE